MRRYPEYVWVYEPRLQAYSFYKAPEEVLGDPELIVRLDRHQYDELKQWMVENDPHGVIQTDRKEDLKVIHRLMDIMEKGVK